MRISLMMLIVVLLSACASAPPSLVYHQLYTGMPASYPATQSDEMITLAPLRVADYLQQAALVMRKQDGTLHYSSTHFWGGSLATDVELQLFDSLNIAASERRYIRYMSPAKAYNSTQLNIALEQLLPTEDGQLLVQISFWLEQDNKLLKNGRLAVTFPIEGAGYERAVSAMRNGLMQIAQQLHSQLN